MFGLAAASVGSYNSGNVAGMGQLGGASMDVFHSKGSKRNRAVDDVNGRQQFSNVHNVMLRELFSVAARLLAVHEVHLCLMLMQALDKKIGGNRLESFNHEEFHSVLQDFVQAEKAKGDDRHVLKELVKKKREEAVPPLDQDDRLRHIWKGGVDKPTACKSRGSFDRTKDVKDEKKMRKEAASSEGPQRSPNRHNSRPKAATQESVPSVGSRDSPKQMLSHRVDSQQWADVQPGEAKSVEARDDPPLPQEVKHASDPSQRTEAGIEEDVVQPVSPKPIQALPPEEDHLQYLPAEEGNGVESLGLPTFSDQDRKQSLLSLEKLVSPSPESSPRSPRAHRMSTLSSSSRQRSRLSNRMSNRLSPIGDRSPSARSSVQSATSEIERITGREAKAIASDNAFLPPPDRLEREIIKRLSVLDVNSEAGSKRVSTVSMRSGSCEEVQQAISPQSTLPRSMGSFRSTESDDVVSNLALPSLGQAEDETLPSSAGGRRISFAPFAQDTKSASAELDDGPLMGRRLSYRERMNQALESMFGNNDDGRGPKITSSRRRSKLALSRKASVAEDNFEAFAARASRRQSLTKSPQGRMSLRRASKLHQQLAGHALYPSWQISAHPLHVPPPLMPLDLAPRSSKERKMERRRTRGSIKAMDDDSLKRLSKMSPAPDFGPSGSIGSTGVLCSSGPTGSTASARSFSKIDPAPEEAYGMIPHMSPTSSMPREDDEEYEDMRNVDSYYSSDEDESFTDESTESDFSNNEEDEDRQLKQWLSGEAKRRSRASTMDTKWKKLRLGGTVAFEDVLEEDTYIMSEPSNRCIMHPDSSFRVLWDITVLCFILFDSFGMSLTLGFDLRFPDEYPWITSGFFITDIVMSLLTGYVMDGVLVMKQNMIIKNYLLTPSRFIIDILASLPWDAIHDGRSGDSHVTEALAFNMMVLGLRCLRLLRVVKLRDTIARFEERFTSMSAVLAFVLGKTLVFFVLLCHWCACFWAFIGTPAKTGFVTDVQAPYDIDVDCERGGPCEAGITGSPWMRRYAIETLEFHQQYIMAVHFAASVITGNDLSMQPGWWLERLFVSAMMMVSLFVCTWMVSQTIFLMQKLRRLQIDFTDTMQMVKDFMTKRNIPMHLQWKVRRYLEYQYENRKARNDNPEFLHHLSPWLQLELRECLHKGVLTRHPFFHQLPDKVLKHICGMTSSVYHAPNDVVVQKGQRASSMCFIVRGRLCVMGIAKGEQGYGHTMLTAPSWIGDMCLFLDMKRTKTVISVTHSELLVVQKNSILLLVNEFPKILTSYRRFKEKVETGDLFSCGILCECCQQYGHAAGDCPQLSSSMRPHELGMMGAGGSSSLAPLTRKSSKGSAKTSSVPLSGRLSSSSDSSHMDGQGSGAFAAMQRISDKAIKILKVPSLKSVKSRSSGLSNDD